MRTVGYWVGRVRGIARHFTAGIENMVREAELEEMEKRWREENERIMRLHPANAHYPEPGQPDEMPPVADVPEPSLPFDETQPEDEIPVEKRPLP
jgi:sec-independent protein translocase protein TatB